MHIGGCHTIWSFAQLLRVHGFSKRYLLLFLLCHFVSYLGARTTEAGSIFFTAHGKCGASGASTPVNIEPKNQQHMRLRICGHFCQPIGAVGGVFPLRTAHNVHCSYGPHVCFWRTKPQLRFRFQTFFLLPLPQHHSSFIIPIQRRLFFFSLQTALLFFLSSVFFFLSHAGKSLSFFFIVL